MPNNVKIVRLTPTPDGVWHPVPPVQLPKNSGEWLISFELTGANAQNVTFDRAEPIWVLANEKPTQKAENSQIPAQVVSEDGKELVVLNLNNNDPNQPPLQLHYRLNFDGYADLDPIIENGGGTKPPLVGDQYDFLTIAIVAIAAFVIGLVVHWGYRKLTGQPG